MSQTIDQVFILLKNWVVGLVPTAYQPLLSYLLIAATLMAVFGGLFAITTIAERKILGRAQNRFGPNRVRIFGFRTCGLIQPIADGIKMLTKEDIVPRYADKVIHLLAPIVMTAPAWLTYSVIPLGRNMTAIDLDAGILFFFAIGSTTELAVFMAGWGSHNKYSLVGSLRAIAQMISYEVPLVLSTIPVLMLAGTLSPTKVVLAQAGNTYLLPNWFVFTPWGFAAALLFLIAATAESNRSPFDIPEGESEIIAGYLTEYSGFKYALFFLGEYVGLFAISGMAITLFFGGWQAPFPFLEFIPSWAWFFAKFLTLIGVFIWVRATLPRLRLDQLLNLSWRFLVPLALINLAVAALWHKLGETTSLPLLGVRWLVAAAVIVICFVLLAKNLKNGKSSQRHYHYAE
jgi:NADH-quinone oxidoreductase subunit H